MEHFKKMAVAVSAALIAVSALSADVFAANDWKAAYSSFLREKLKSDEHSMGAFSVYDIDSNGTPELIYSNGNYHLAQCSIYTYSDGKMINIDELGSGGQCSVIPSKKYLVGSYAGGGEYFVSFFALQDNKLETVASFHDNENTGLVNAGTVYEINEKSVTADEYYRTLNKVRGDDSVSLGRTYPLCEESIGYAVTGAEDHRQGYASLLRTKYQDDADESDVFALYDITGDKVPELLVRSGYSTCIYTFADGRVQYIGEETPRYISADDVQYSWGYNAQRGLLMLCAYSKTKKSYSYGFYTQKDGCMVCSASARCGYDYNDNFVYYVNGSEVSYKEYRKTLEKYRGVKFKKIKNEHPLQNSEIERILGH